MSQMTHPLFIVAQGFMFRIGSSLTPWIFWCLCDNVEKVDGMSKCFSFKDVCDVRGSGENVEQVSDFDIVHKQNLFFWY